MHQAARPIWASRREVRRLCGVSRYALDDMVQRGLVRSAKLAPLQRATRLFSIEDIEAYLAALGEGREPRRPQRHVHRRPAVYAGR